MNVTITPISLGDECCTGCQGPLLAGLLNIYRNLEIGELPGVGHALPEEAPQAVNDLLVVFLANLVPAQAPARTAFKSTTKR